MMSKRSLFQIVFLLLVSGLVAACAGEADEANYRILSPTPRPQLTVTAVPTVAAQDLTAAPSATRTATLMATATEAPASPTPSPDSPTPADSSPSASPETPATDATTVTPTAQNGQTDGDSAPSGPTPTSINPILRQRQQDRDFLVQFQLERSCFLTNTEIPARIVVTNFREGPIYLYTRGQLLFSINNSNLEPDFSPPEPTLREDFVLLETTESYTFELEDLGLFIQGMGPVSGIDFSDTFLGLPSGEYWVTAAYSNDKDGLTEQQDGSYLIPQAAWRGTGVSREVRFTVVDDLADCPGAE